MYKPNPTWVYTFFIFDTEVRLNKMLIFIMLFALIWFKASTILFVEKNQTFDVDSLYNAALNSQKEGRFQESISLFQKCIPKFEKQKNIESLGNCYTKIGNSYYFLGNFDAATNSYKKSIIVFKSINNIKGISSSTNNLGAINYSLGNLPAALKYYNSVLDIQKKIGDPKIIAATNQNIGSIYYKIEDYHKALKYYEKSYHISVKLRGDKEISKVSNSLGLVYVKLKNNKLAKHFLTAAYKLSQKIQDKQIQVEALSSLGELYLAEEKYSKALEYFDQCLLLSLEISSQQYISSSKISIGKIENKLQKSKSAIKYCQSGLAIANEINSLSLKKDACDCLYDGYKISGNSTLALSYFEKSKLYQDSLNTNETSNKMMSMEFQNKQLLDSLAFVNQQHAVQLKHKEEIHQKERQRNYTLGTLGFILLLAGGLYSRLNFVRKSKKALQFEKDRSEKLLLNILPEEIAEELKEKGSVNARDFNLVAILFTDFKSFTQTAEQMTPQELVEEINVCFKAFDLISEKYNIEKIKTIGDSYMAAGGIPIPDESFLENIVLAGLEMQEFMFVRKQENDLLNKPAFEMRLGIHAGPIVAGIVGIRKFQYDVWGDTVNTASRIESNGTVGKVNISESLYQLLKNSDQFVFEYRGNIHAKGKGNINMYYVEKKANSIELSVQNKILAEH